MKQGDDIFRYFGFPNRPKRTLSNRLADYAIYGGLIVGGLGAFTIWNFEIVEELYKKLPVIADKVFLSFAAFILLFGRWLGQRHDRKRLQARPIARRQIGNDYAILTRMRAKKART